MKWESGKGNGITKETPIQVPFSKDYGNGMMIRMGIADKMVEGK